MDLNALEHVPRLVSRAKALLGLVHELKEKRQMAYWDEDIVKHWDSVTSQLNATIHDMENGNEG